MRLKILLVCLIRSTKNNLIFLCLQPFRKYMETAVFLCPCSMYLVVSNLQVKQNIGVFVCDGHIEKMRASARYAQTMYAMRIYASKWINNTQ
jgi:hypothetical protein